MVYLWPGSLPSITSPRTRRGIRARVVFLRWSTPTRHVQTSVVNGSPRCSHEAVTNGNFSITRRYSVCEQGWSTPSSTALLFLQQRCRVASHTLHTQNASISKTRPPGNRRSAVSLSHSLPPMGQDVWYVLDTRVLEQSEASARSTSSPRHAPHPEVADLSTHYGM